jgi:hypothetical protein
MIICLEVFFPALALIKVAWLAASIALRVVGALFVVVPVLA